MLGTVLGVFILFFLLLAKHLVIDFMWQPEYEWKNKGTYGHMGGIRHSAKHVAGSFFILLGFVSVPIALLICLGEFLIHYHMDWFKMWWGKRWNYTPMTPEFYVWFGIDQFVHSVTYWGISLIVLLLLVL